MCDIQNNGKIQREFETRSTDDQPTIQWLPVVGSWTFLGVNMHFNEKLFMCDSCNFLVRVYLLLSHVTDEPNQTFHTIAKFKTTSRTILKKMRTDWKCVAA